ncbi:hypothetical protein [Stenotrophomonas sp. BIGb0135]|uniref:hypothetical protein n=1 Tax=Stenotrophomonas sp. BIGb0135 TaxID=2940620 RepID=UPI002169497C|nr:hypothetical protein [Stenotrophomonas sp. BIGb0135]MCS4234402.1 hypothetical protein [Stenotrophomonas sp. BIGb0135]
MANVKYADPSFPAITPTDDDQLMFRTAAGADGRAPLVQPKGHIDGLKLVWVSGTQVQVTSGAAYVPGPKRIAELASAVTLTPTLAANTWYHIYLTVSGSTVGVETVTTAPAAPYSGTARAKTGDTSRRYIGSFRTNSAGAIFKFDHSPQSGTFEYVENISSPDFLILNSRPTSAVSVSVDTRAPVTRSAVLLQYLNLCNANAYVSSTDGPVVADGSWRDFVPPSQKSSMPLSLRSGQDLTVIVPSSSSGLLYLWCSGFRFER